MDLTPAAKAMLRLVLVVACALLVCHGSAKKPSMSQKMMSSAIAAASVVRINGTYKQDSSSCQWPMCAPVCDHCPASKMGPCLVPVFEKCPLQAECLMGTCFCKDGYCPSTGACVSRTCSYGAKPPPNVKTEYMRRFAQMGLPPPGPGATADDWKAFIKGSAKLPAILLAVGVVISLTTCACVVCHLECQCSWLPKKPWLLLVFCGIVLAIIAVGMSSRSSVIDNSFSLASEQVARMQNNLNDAIRLSKQLDQMCETLQNEVDQLPSSCSKLALGTNAMMDLAAKKANATLQSMKGKVYTFGKLSTNIKSYVDKLANALPTLKRIVDYAPMGPLLFLFVWTFIIAIASSITMFSPNSRASDCADNFVLRCGPLGTCLAMNVAACLAAGWLFAGLLVGSTCMDIHNNALNYIQTVNFTKLYQKHEEKKGKTWPYDINPIMYGAAKYYIQGSQENPMISMVQSAQNDATALYTIYTNASFFTGAAEAVCKGVKSLNPNVAMGNFDTSCTWLISMMRADNMWPYYKSLFQDILCGNMLKSMTLLIIYTTAVSHILMPIICILADIDMRRWVEHKESTGENYAQLKLEDDSPSTTHGANDEPSRLLNGS